MPAKPTNSDLQRQLYGVQTEMRNSQTELKHQIETMSGKLDKALEHSAAHKARLDGHDKGIESNTKALGEERLAREGQFMWTLGSGLTALIAFLAALLGWARGG